VQKRQETSTKLPARCPGRRGPLAADPAEETRSQPGIEVRAAQAGKRGCTAWRCLSGGEKASARSRSLRRCPRAAVTVLPLDEVKAALDDTNIGRFVELLRNYSRPRASSSSSRTRKRTIEAADVLYGVHDGRRRRLAGSLAAAAARRGHVQSRPASREHLTSDHSTRCRALRPCASGIRRPCWTRSPRSARASRDGGNRAGDGACRARRRPGRRSSSANLAAIARRNAPGRASSSPTSKVG